METLGGFESGKQFSLEFTDSNQIDEIMEFMINTFKQYGIDLDEQSRNAIKSDTQRLYESGGGVIIIKQDKKKVGWLRYGPLQEVVKFENLRAESYIPKSNFPIIQIREFKPYPKVLTLAQISEALNTAITELIKSSDVAIDLARDQITEARMYTGLGFQCTEEIIQIDQQGINPNRVVYRFIKRSPSNPIEKRLRNARQN